MTGVLTHIHTKQCNGWASSVIFCLLKHTWYVHVGLYFVLVLTLG